MIYKEQKNFTERPAISVILTAYNRKMFIENALNSILSQNFDLRKVELIIISNFEIKIQSKLEELNRVKMILLDDSMGIYLKIGIKESIGEVIVFLDDDDILTQEKLSVVHKNFSEYKDLVYYHNAVFYINEIGKFIDYARLVEKKHMKNITSYYSRSGPLKNIKRMLKSNGDFNLSSISIRRNTILPHIYLLDKLESNPDGFFFFISLLLGGDIMVDNRKLTLYRVHSINTSASSNYKYKSAEILRQIKTFNILLEFIKNNKLNSLQITKISEWINILKEEYELMFLLFSNSNRMNIMRKLKELFNHPIEMNNILKIRLTIIALIYILNPNTAFYIYKNLQK